EEIEAMLANILGRVGGCDAPVDAGCAVSNKFVAAEGLDLLGLVPRDTHLEGKFNFAPSALWTSGNAEALGHVTLKRPVVLLHRIKVEGRLTFLLLVGTPVGVGVMTMKAEELVLPIGVLGHRAGIAVDGTDLRVAGIL